MPDPGPAQMIVEPDAGPAVAAERVPVMFRWLPPLLAVAAVGLLPVAAATTDLSALDGWGLARVLGPAAWASLLCAVGACVVELWSPRPRVPMLGVGTAVLILCSFGMPSVVEPAARFTTAWLISGFVDAIATTDGRLLTDVDARFHWPAFLAQWAFFRDAGGATQLDTVLRWFPPVIVGVWAVGVYALASTMLGGSRAPWVATWLFLGLNWIEQDYFSPQAMGIVLMLTVLTFTLGPLATRRVDREQERWPVPSPGAGPLPLWRRWVVATLTPPDRPALPPGQLLLIYFCCALCLLAAVPEHQLTPLAIVGQLIVLAVVGRFRGRGLVLVAVVAVAVYFVVALRDLWFTQLSLVTGTDDTGGQFESGIIARLEGDFGQVAVKVLRIVVPVLTWVLGIAGAWVYWQRRRDLVPIALAAVPMAFAATPQSYGGELFLRIVLYGLPILAILGTDALRALVRRRRRTEYLLAVGMALLFGSIILIRGGNEAYMIVYPREVEMVREVYATTPPGQKIVPLSDVGPYAVEGIATHRRDSGVPGCREIADDPIRCITEENPDVLLSFDSVEAEGRYLNLKPPGWSLQVVQQLVASGRYEVTYQDGYDVVLRRTTSG